MNNLQLLIQLHFFLLYRNHAITPEQNILLTLRYYATGSFIVVCKDFIGIHKSTAAEVIKEVSEALAKLRPQFIRLPSNETEKSQIRIEFYKVAKFPRCIGTISTTHVRIRQPIGNTAETFRNMYGYHSMKVQTICDAKLKIQSIVARWPGSVENSTIFRNSQLKCRFENGEFGDDVLLGDSSFDTRSYLITPILSTTSLAEQLFNLSHDATTTQTVEWSYGHWKRRFLVLCTRMELKINTVLTLIIATAALHKIAIDMGEEVPSNTRILEHQINTTMDRSS